VETNLYLDILQQPDSRTCGPTCLHAVYRYFDDQMALSQVISEVTYLEEGGTLAVYLACHALLRGYKAIIYTYDLQVFDPTWFTGKGSDISEKLKLQLQHKKGARNLEVITHAYLKFLELGGQVRFEVLSASLIRKFLNRLIPVLTGLSATFLYNSAREVTEGDRLSYDDIRGEPMGHFVVLAGYERAQRNVFLADPLMPNPVSASQLYKIDIQRLVCAILLGTVTYDGDLLIIEPGKKGSSGRSVLV
jgi:hypothetical protein